MKYINTNRNQTASTYAQIEPMFDGSDLTFTLNTVKPNVGGKPLPMVKGNVRVMRPTAVTVCDDPCGASVNSMVEIRFNVRQGDTAVLNALLAEAKRCLEASVTDYQLANGVLPPVVATFEN